MYVEAWDIQLTNLESLTPINNLLLRFYVSIRICYSSYNWIKFWKSFIKFNQFTDVLLKENDEKTYYFKMKKLKTRNIVAYKFILKSVSILIFFTVIQLFIMGSPFEVIWGFILFCSGQ